MEHTEIRRFFEGYMDTFNRLDGPGAAAYYSAPSFVVKNGGLERFGPAEKSDYFSSLMQSNATAGAHVWEIAGFELALPASGAIATVHWIGRRPDGSVMWDFRDTYFLGDSGDGWRILGDMVHDSL